MTVALRARPTTYNGIEMRSRLEARVAAFLDDEGLTWQYEPRAFASGRTQYLPDFVIQGVSDPLGFYRDWYLEVKGVLPESDQILRLQKRMTVIHSADPMAGLLISTADGMERAYYINSDFSVAVLFACPWHSGNVFFGREYGGGDAETYVGHCPAHGCLGVAWRVGDRDDPRLVLPEWEP